MDLLAARLRDSLGTGDWGQGHCRKVQGQNKKCDAEGGRKRGTHLLPRDKMVCPLQLLLNSQKCHLDL